MSNFFTILRTKNYQNLLIIDRGITQQQEGITRQRVSVSISNLVELLSTCRATP